MGICPLCSRKRMDGKKTVERTRSDEKNLSLEQKINIKSISCSIENGGGLLSVQRRIYLAKEDFCASCRKAFYS